MSQNKLAFILALLITAFVMTLFIPAMSEAKDLTLTQEINKARVKPLTEDKVLIKYALIRCKTMKTWSHDGFLDIAYDVMYVYGRNGIITRYKDVGENLANGFSTAGSTMQAWMNSPIHKANIEDPRYTRIGIATCRNVLGTTTVALFGGK